VHLFGLYYKRIKQCHIFYCILGMSSPSYIKCYNIVHPVSNILYCTSWKEIISFSTVYLNLWYLELSRILLPMAHQPLLDQSLVIIEVSRSHSDTPQSVGLLWTRERPVAQTSTRQHTTLTTDRHPCLRRIRTRILIKLEAVSLRPRSHGHCNLS